jgi:hypothetical protein
MLVLAALALPLAAAANGLNQVRGVWPVPTGGYLLGTDAGSQVLYVDPAGILYIFVDGHDGSHSGDGQWFYSPGNAVDTGVSWCAREAPTDTTYSNIQHGVLFQYNTSVAIYLDFNHVGPSKFTSRKSNSTWAS